MKIDYSKLDPKVERTVFAMEGKPHIAYIRYLISKGYSPVYIKRELFKSGFSAPHEEVIKKYFLAIMDPIIRHFGLQKIYDSYKKKIMLRQPDRAPGSFTKELINYRITFGEDYPELQPNFHYFVKYIETETLWGSEILRYHGSAIYLPKDENGNAIIGSENAVGKGYEKVLFCEKRYIIDKLLLENYPEKRIETYLKDRVGIKDITSKDIKLYKRVFFNLRSVDIDQAIQALEIEKEALVNLVKNIGAAKVEEKLTNSDVLLIKKQNQERIEELENNIRHLTAQHADAAFNAAEIETANYEGMFADVMVRAYKRFTDLDAEKRSDVIDPLSKVANMMKVTHDKLTDIKSNPVWQQNTDKEATGALATLYKGRLDEIAREQTNQANDRIKAIGGKFTMDDDIPLDEVQGIEEVSNVISKDDDIESEMEE